MVGKLVACQCDRYVSSINPQYPANRLKDVIESSMCCKARLLHYYPKLITSDNSNVNESIDDNINNDLEFSSWCGWHNDHGSLTGLVSAIFLNELGQEIPCPDPSAG